MTPEEILIEIIKIKKCKPGETIDQYTKRVVREMVTLRTFSPVYMPDQYNPFDQNSHFRSDF